MEEFILLMRLDLLNKAAQPSPEQMEVYMKQHQDWIGGIAAQNKFVGGTGLSMEGKVLRHNDVVTDGPYVAIKESLAGFILIRANDFDEAVSIAKGSPILQSADNSLEIRRVMKTS